MEEHLDHYFFLVLCRKIILPKIRMPSFNLLEYHTKYYVHFNTQKKSWSTWPAYASALLAS